MCKIHLLHSTDDIDPEIKAAVKSVAKSLKEDSTQAESDILQQLRSHGKTSLSNKAGSKKPNLETTPTPSMRLVTLYYPP